MMTSLRSDPVDDETDEDEGDNNNNENSKGPSNADAFSAIETAMGERCHVFVLFSLNKDSNLKKFPKPRLWRIAHFVKEAEPMPR
ncbi:hypothetical protein TNCV_1169021 [Trichonephila clavipes]|uniref:Uncharacterized protein n=1 Tax=Trichonephila clavipes TaxID=2585209 RepID=A0A8X6VSU7_TRICX|nr:hypothetical protein TNCV_1169021 [Trichonephila clavipes]